MKLIIALGNAEPRYDRTRHNVGFDIVDEFAATRNMNFKKSVRFKALIAEGTLKGEKTIIAKPTTYYNLVGEAARALIDFYHLENSDVLVVHDDLNLPLGTVRTRVGGSDGGNNGLKSLAAHIGTDTARIRVGTWTDEQHADKVSVVLGKLTRQEQKTIDELKPTIYNLIDQFIADDFPLTTHR